MQVAVVYKLWGNEEGCQTKMAMLKVKSEVVPDLNLSSTMA
jgi:hypothetical protein